MHPGVSAKNNNFRIYVLIKKHITKRIFLLEIRILFRLQCVHIRSCNVDYLDVWLF